MDDVLNRALLSILVVTAGLSGAAVLSAAPKSIEQFGKLSLQFEKNDGQTDPRVRFLARTEGYSLFLTDSSEAVVNLDGEVMKMRLAGPLHTRHSGLQERANHSFRP